MTQIVGFYTKGTPYEEQIKPMVGSAKRFKYDIFTLGYNSTGSWVGNCALKPAFIQHCLKEFSEFYYLDADAEIEREIPKIDADFAYYLKGNELLSGTLYFKRSPETIKLVDMWVKKQTPGIWDQKVLQSLSAYFPKKTVILPEKMCHIFDKPITEPPVIIHYQASRKFKRSIVMSNNIGKSRLRTNPDGSVCIPRRDAEAEKILDRDMVRVPNQLRWVPKDNSTQIFEDLRIKADHAYIVGKGPSLDFISKKDFPDKDAPIICVNESIHPVEALNLPNPIFCICQDSGLRDTCKPKKATLLVGLTLKNWYADYENKFVINPRSLLTQGIMNITCNLAIMILKKNDIKEITMVCFDGSVNQKTGYANIVGYDAIKGGKLDRFLKQKGSILAAIGPNIKTNWSLPVAPDSKQRKSAPIVKDQSLES